MVGLDDAQEALAAGSWSRAGSAFRAVIDQTDDPLAHEGLAQVAWWLDDADLCLDARETAYRLHRARGDLVGAARVAGALAWDSQLFGRGESVARGWLGRAHVLLTALDEGREHGWYAVRETELALATGQDSSMAWDCAARAAEIGTRTGDGDLCVVASALQGLVLTRSGEVGRGMAYLDEAVAAATGGDVVDQMWMGKVLCWLILACHEAQDVARAEAWCRRVEAIGLDRHLGPLLDVCRIQYAWVQVSAGVWAEAELALEQTVVHLAASSRGSRSEAVVQLGELRRRQGRLVEADALFRQAEFDPVAERGRAQIRFASGDRTGAWAAVQRLLRTLPPDALLARADALLPAVRIAHALGHHEAAGSAAVELRSISTTVGTDALRAMSAIADAVLAGPADAPALLLEAVRRYQAAGLRHDEAEARLLLASALLTHGEEEAARDQVTSAREVMTGLGDTAGLEAAGDLARILAPSVSGTRPGVLSPREREVLRLVARGLNNDEIAGALTLSAHTVHRHVANILAKLGEPTRAAAVAHALTRSLI